MGVRRDAMSVMIAWDDERGTLDPAARAEFDHDTLERMYALLVGGAAVTGSSAQEPGVSTL